MVTFLGEEGVAVLAKGALKPKLIKLTKHTTFSVPDSEENLSAAGVHTSEVEDAQKPVLAAIVEQNKHLADALQQMTRQMQVSPARTREYGGITDVMPKTGIMATIAKKAQTDAIRTLHMTLMKKPASTEKDLRVATKQYDDLLHVIDYENRYGKALSAAHPYYDDNGSYFQKLDMETLKRTNTMATYLKKSGAFSELDVQSALKG